MSTEEALLKLSSLRDLFHELLLQKVYWRRQNSTRQRAKDTAARQAHASEIIDTAVRTSTTMEDKSSVPLRRKLLLCSNTADCVFETTQDDLLRAHIRDGDASDVYWECPACWRLACTYDALSRHMQREQDKRHKIYKNHPRDRMTRDHARTKRRQESNEVVSYGRDLLQAQLEVEMLKEAHSGEKVWTSPGDSNDLHTYPPTFKAALAPSRYNCSKSTHQGPTAPVSQTHARESLEAQIPPDGVSLPDHNQSHVASHPHRVPYDRYDTRNAIIPTTARIGMSIQEFEPIPFKMHEAMPLQKDETIDHVERTGQVVDKLDDRWNRQEHGRNTKHAICDPATPRRRQHESISRVPTTLSPVGYVTVSGRRPRAISFVRGQKQLQTHQSRMISFEEESYADEDEGLRRNPILSEALQSTPCSNTSPTTHDTTAEHVDDFGHFANSPEADHGADTAPLPDSHVADAVAQNMSCADDFTTDVTFSGVQGFPTAVSVSDGSGVSRGLGSAGPSTDIREVLWQFKHTPVVQQMIKAGEVHSSDTLQLMREVLTRNCHARANLVAFRREIGR